MYRPPEKQGFKTKFEFTAISTTKMRGTLSNLWKKRV